MEEEVNYNPTLEIGDFLCKDGTTIDKDYNLEQLDEAVKASIIGVVYYVGNPQPSVLYNGTYAETQDVLKRECPSCVNGLAIASLIMLSVRVVLLAVDLDQPNLIIRNG